jgi:hypothetical protein
MLSKCYTKATRDQTAVFVARSTVSKCYVNNGVLLDFSDGELLEAVQHVETVYGTFEERPDQFHAVVATVALQVAENAGRYGPHGYDDEHVIAGRSSMRYWIDTLSENDSSMAKSVERVAKLPPPRFELDVAPEPKSSARCCSGPGAKHKFGVGEPRLVLALWEPNVLARSGSVVRSWLTSCCLDAVCVHKFERDNGVALADAMPAAHLGPEARAAVEARKAALLVATDDAPPPPKSDACFPKDRKREPKRDDDEQPPLALDWDRVRSETKRRADGMQQAALLGHRHTESKRQREAREAADEDRKMRYRPTLDAHKDAVLDEANPLCAYVFENDPFGQPGPFKCPYDHKADAPFCTQCAMVVDALCQA